MDIGKYIGLFLLKNQFCYVHGLGNLELLKRPAKHNGKELEAPYYEIVVTNGGSIDDNLANFIATNEQISISKAANALRDYSIQVRTELAVGKEVPLPNLGRFIEDKGRVKFITDENFKYTPAGIPTIKNSKQLEEQNSKPVHKPSYPTPHKADSVNWSMVILATILLIIIGGGIYGIYHYTRKDKVVNEVSPVIIDTPVQAQKPVTTDTSQVHKDTVAAAPATPAAPAMDSVTAYPFKMIIGDYPTMAKAEKRQTNLKLNGNKNVDILAKDSTDFLIITTINCRVRDTTHVIDSLHRLYGYKGVKVLP